MRFIVDVRIECAGRATPPPVLIGVIERCADASPATGLGLLLQEAMDLLQQLQTIVVSQQATQFVDSASKCRACSAPLGTKDTKQVVYRTVFGVARWTNPRLYSRCSGCGMPADSGQTFSPLAQALPERTHPQWTWLQCRDASVMSFRLTQIFLGDAFPAGKSLPVASIEVDLRAVGIRLEREAELAVSRVVAQLHAYRRTWRLPHSIRSATMSKPAYDFPQFVKQCVHLAVVP